ncbi:reverse transcriptase domain-containing protein [Nephila pilipes]|uniref:Reverse transcriptase domain-containing protein n=1 Tax=Nephila pilipes TaxID=299642 RepID=A0A8X6NIF9_NEPPI|nr:reverse transcriptase domain-containing protein [Nephila pilipes]
MTVRDSHNLKPTNHTVAVFLDLTKAFDRMWINKLLIKLFDTFKVNGKVFVWIDDLLKGRPIYVHFNESIFRDLRLSQGLPNGFELSSLFFSVYLTQIEKVNTHNCKIGSFTDDVIIWDSNLNIRLTEKVN